MILAYHKDFKKNYQKLSKRTQEKFDERVLLFQKDQFDPVLNNHSLRGNYLSCRSINVTGDIRAIFKKDGEKVIFIAINSHSNLYS